MTDEKGFEMAAAQVKIYVLRVCVSVCASMCRWLVSSEIIALVPFDLERSYSVGIQGRALCICVRLWRVYVCPLCV